MVGGIDTHITIKNHRYMCSCYAIKTKSTLKKSKNITIDNTMLGNF